MKRFHVHVGVKDLESSIRFYSALFGAEPTVTKSDYAKWMVNDPRINFAISRRGEQIGVNHLGLQVDSNEELEALRTQAGSAELAAVAEKGGNCCYARSDKYWYTDPQGVAWETYHTLNQVEFFGSDADTAVAKASCGSESQSSCCAPTSDKQKLEGERTSTACCS
jgi:catechol 2,3-dioxygenase-like lactoylglutathione lyase family enzyme